MPLIFFFFFLGWLAGTAPSAPIVFQGWLAQKRNTKGTRNPLKGEQIPGPGFVLG